MKTLYIQIQLLNQKKKKKCDLGKERQRFVITHPLYMRPGGRRQHPLLRKQYRPMATAVLLAGAAPPEPGTAVRARSPRIMASCIMTVFPPSIIFWVPTRVALRATLLPVSYRSRRRQGFLLERRKWEEMDSSEGFRAYRLNILSPGRSSRHVGRIKGGGSNCWPQG